LIDKGKVKEPLWMF